MTSWLRNLSTLADEGGGGSRILALNLPTMMTSPCVTSSYYGGGAPSTQGHILASSSS